MRHLITEREAAERLGISVNTLRQWRTHNDPTRRTPRLAYHKIGGAVKYDAAYIDAFVERSRVVRPGTFEAAVEEAGAD